MYKLLHSVYLLLIILYGFLVFGVFRHSSKLNATISDLTQQNKSLEICLERSKRQKSFELLSAETKKISDSVKQSILDEEIEKLDLLDHKLSDLGNYVSSLEKYEVKSSCNLDDEEFCILITLLSFYKPSKLLEIIDLYEKNKNDN